MTAAGANLAADGVRDLLPAGAALQADTLERRKEASVSLHNWQHVLAELGQRAAEMNAYTLVILAHHIPHLCVFIDDCEVVQILFSRSAAHRGDEHLHARHCGAHHPAHVRLS